jgi:outer membrane scaffolding protein for murein synthesis (MipA/OmpV family)
MCNTLIFRRFAAGFGLGLILAGSIILGAAPARAQTPSPLAEWQFSSGIQIARLFEPTIPNWESEVGLGTELSPVFEGSARYQVRPGPAIDIRYKDIAFISSGEGIGANLFSFRHVRFGAAISYDLGRSPHADGEALSGLGTIHTAAEFKIFGDYTLARGFPLNIRFDVRKQLGATWGYIGDVGAYLPMPGSSETFVWFAGPTVTIADNRYMNAYFGISHQQAANTHYKFYKADGGFKSAGFGISAAYIVTPHIVLSVDGAVQRLLGSAAFSPITQTRYQETASLSALYKF